ncbi:MAG: hypothetical protein JWM95_2344 [Gemmatimonadetes bacterium]|nr:hypothetical protein [Gemmatimonadota bacterium]
MNPSDEFFTPPPAGGETGNAANAVEKIWPYVQAAVELTARTLTRDYDQREDLIAEAWKVLWSKDASRCNVQDQEDLRNLRKILINRMRNYAESRAMKMNDAEGRLPEDLVRLLA